MNAPTRLLLVRHADPAEEARGRCYGRLDFALSPAGRRRAAKVAAELRTAKLTALYTSPALRAVETATAIGDACGLVPVSDASLRELDFGRIEGLSYDAVERDEPELYREWMDAPTRVRFPGGESFDELRARVLPAFEAIRARHEGSTAVVVSHAGPLRAALAAWLELPDAAVFRLALDLGAVSVVEWSNGAPIVRLLNGSAATAAQLPGAPSAVRPASALRHERPLLPPGYDDSRARSRREDPYAWRFPEPARAGVWRAIRERRDIRRFRPEAVSDEMLERLLEAAHAAPSVGLMQPWRFIVVRAAETKAAMQGIAARERLVQAEHFDERMRQYLELKLEGIREAPLSICVCCDREAGGPEVLGRHTIPDTDIYSTCLAIENFWLAARAEGVGVGWVSFYRPADLQELLGMPAHLVPVAWLCVGYPDERPTRPGLEAAGWGKRRPLAELVYDERWREPLEPPGRPRPPRLAESACRPQPSWLKLLTDAVRPGDATAALRVRDESDELVKPPGSLGVLEAVVERWALATGSPPPLRPQAAILVCAADHGVAKHGVSLYPERVSAQVAAAAARGETAIGVLARTLGAELVVADVGLRGPRLSGLRDCRAASGSADIVSGPAMSTDELRRALEAGHALGSELAGRCDVLLLGEIGIANTTVAAALLAALTGLSAEQVCGRGTGLDAQGLEQKRATVAAALERNTPPAVDPLECLRLVGGFDIAALVGALLGAAAARRMILLDGLAVGVAALVGCRLVPSLRDSLIAGHRSAEPAHGRVLTELGLEPLLDLRLRLGEASGAALAFPLLGLSAALHLEMSHFDEALVDGPELRPRREPGRPAP